MPVEYDLVVIGGSSAGLRAAVAATHLKARVALVEKQQLGETSHHRNALMEVGRVANQMRAAVQFGVYSEPESLRGVSGRCDRAMQWAEAVVTRLAERNSRASLESLGVEVIFGAGQFYNQPLGFSVNGRQLRARAYLIATGVRIVNPNIPGLEAVGYLTSDDLSSTQPLQWPQDLLVIGGGIIGTELSQTLTRLGSRVTLAVEGPHVLAQEDTEAARLVQAQLEAEGVRILTQAQVTQAKKIDGKKWVLAGAQALEASEILLTVGQRPQVEFLNLAAVGVKVNPQGIQVNHKLQTSHPRIYACGDAIGGYQLAHVGNYEAGVALKNALFWPIFKVNYRAIPWAVFTDPELARVGLTEFQARQRFGQKVQVLKQFYKTLDRAQMRGETTGFCKIIVQPSGTILGAHLVGPAAAEIIPLIALAMQQRLKVHTLSELVHISPTFSEITFQTVTARQVSSPTPRQNFLESFFNLRRSWSS